jgi:hypothetical protein
MFFIKHVNNKCPKLLFSLKYSLLLTIRYFSSSYTSVEEKSKEISFVKTTNKFVLKKTFREFERRPTASMKNSLLKLNP